MISYGIKLSIDNGLAGDVVLEAKTSKLAKHYEKDFGAVHLPVFHSSTPRYLIADEAAKRIFHSLGMMTEEVYPMSNNLMSDAMWYCRKDPEEERFYEIFSIYVRSIMCVRPVLPRRKSTLLKR